MGGEDIGGMKPNNNGIKSPMDSLCPKFSARSSRDGILLNTLPIRAGGGLQKTLSLFDQWAKLGQGKVALVAIAVEGGALEAAAKRANIPIVPVSPGLISRLWFELCIQKKFRKNSLCFTLSGPIMIGSGRYFLNVTECAYSNLFYPEIDFWRYLPFFKRLKKRLVDQLRKQFTKKADFWIFQTEVIRERAVRDFGFPRARTKVVRVALSGLVSPGHVKPAIANGLDKSIPKGKRLLFLNGPNPNKRLHLLGPFARELKRLGWESFSLVTTLPFENEYTKRVENHFKRWAVLDHFFNIGPLKAEDVASCISVVEALCCFSVLESFSNNFIEAWGMEKPLFATDADWSRCAAKDAAIFIHIENPKEAAKKVCDLFDNPSAIENLLKSGRKRLSEYATPESKWKAYRDALMVARALGPCPEKERSNIKW